jgi:hypothetical protein
MVAVVREVGEVGVAVAGELVGAGTVGEAVLGEEVGVSVGVIVVLLSILVTSLAVGAVVGKLIVAAVGDWLGGISVSLHAREWYSPRNSLGDRANSFLPEREVLLVLSVKPASTKTSPTRSSKYRMVPSISMCPGRVIRVMMGETPVDLSGSWDHP